MKYINQKGMAILMVLSTTAFIMILLQNTISQTQMARGQVSAELQSLQSYYAAKAGMEINILRVKAYKRMRQVIELNKDRGAEIMAPFTDIIWQAPFNWPPELNENLDGAIAEEEINKLKKNSLMQADFRTSLIPASSFLNLNDLASPMGSVSEWSFQMFVRLISNLRQLHTNLSDEISEEDIPDIVTNIKDWADPDSDKGRLLTDDFLSNGENALYPSPINAPNNRAFMSIQELKQVEGVSDLLFQYLKPYITIYGEMGLHINFAPPLLLQSLHDDFPPGLAEEIAEGTDIQPGRMNLTKNSLQSLLHSRDLGHIADTLFPAFESFLLFSGEKAPNIFQMKSEGHGGKQIKRTITALFFDKDHLKHRFTFLMNSEINKLRSTNENKPGGGGTNQKPKTDPQPKSISQNLSITHWKVGF